MRLADIVNGPWAITPVMLDEIQGIYARHLRGDKIDLAGVEASLGRPLNSEPKDYTVQDGVAIIAVDGVIAKKMNLFSKISGGVSTELLGRDFAAALADRSVEAIVLAIDSPGGTVDGTPEMASQILAARGTKPVLAYTDGMMCSAAYWIGSAADSINISSDVVMVGSIGVVAGHRDVSKAEEKMGVKTTEITAGKYKRVASQYAPLTEEGRANIQDMVDHVYSVFVDQVAAARGVSAEEVINRMADGRVFHGRQAIEAGLVDGVATLAETINQARDLARGKSQKRGAGAASATKEQNMDIKTLKENHPDLVAQITQEAQSGMAEAIATAQTAGATAELQRIKDVRAQLIPGHEATIEKLAFDGKSTGADAAMAMVAAEKGLREAAASDLDKDANQALAPVKNEEGAKQIKRAAFNDLGQPERRAFLASGGKIVD